MRPCAPQFSFARPCRHRVSFRDHCSISPNKVKRQTQFPVEWDHPCFDSGMPRDLIDRGTSLLLGSLRRPSPMPQCVLRCQPHLNSTRHDRNRHQGGTPARGSRGPPLGRECCLDGNHGRYNGAFGKRALNQLVPRIVRSAARLYQHSSLGLAGMSRLS